MAERDTRRSPRIVRVIPVLVGTDAPDLPAHTRVINRHGALILSPRSWPLETRVQMLNPKSGRSSLCRVAWEGGEEGSTGSYKLGLELLHPIPDFWGDDYAPDENPLPGS